VIKRNMAFYWLTLGGLVSSTAVRVDNKDCFVGLGAYPGILVAWIVLGALIYLHDRTLDP
jgi:hypothetical protein